MFFNDILEDSSDSDDDNNNGQPQRPRWYPERQNYFDTLDDIDFVTRFRLSKESAMMVLQSIEEVIEYNSDRNQSISPMNQLLATLRFYATGSQQISVADFAGCSKSTANRIIHRVSCAIANLADHYIKFPASQQEIRNTEIGFYNIARFPRVVGAIDGTHIRISSPGGANAELFRNRKGYFSLNVQAICDANLNILNLVARWPGSTHDSTVFNNSYQKILFENGTYGASYLLGDQGYACKSYLQTPLQNPATRAEQLYNESQIRTRNPVERLFGIWKRRFPVLALGLRVKLENVYPIIVSTAVLHNILLTTNDILVDDPELNLPQPWEELIALGQLPMGRQINGNPNFNVRRQLINNYFQSLLDQNN